MASKTFFPDEVVFQYSSTAPAPSKDFAQILVTFNQVIHRVWKIVPPMRCDGNNPPVEVKDSYHEFIEDDRLQSEIERTFGPEMVEYICGLTRGQIDYVLHLPTTILTKICLMLNLEDLQNLSRVCRLFRNLCNSDKLWEKIYRKYHKSQVGPQLENLAVVEGWKRLFFTNKLQLQVAMKRHKSQAV